MIFLFGAFVLRIHPERTEKNPAVVRGIKRSAK